MSKKTTKPAEVEETAAEEAVAAPAEEAPAAEPAETVAEPAAEKAVSEAEAAPEADTEACDESLCGKGIRFVSTIVQKIKEKTTKPEADLPHEYADADGDLDEIILDDDIIAELQEYERREKMKKKIALCAAGALVLGIIIGVCIKSKKNKKD